MRLGWLVFGVLDSERGCLAGDLLRRSNRSACHGSERVWVGADGRTRTDNRLFTRQVRYQLRHASRVGTGYRSQAGEGSFRHPGPRGRRCRPCASPGAPASRKAACPCSTRLLRPPTPSPPPRDQQRPARSDTGTATADPLVEAARARTRAQGWDSAVAPGPLRRVDRRGSGREVEDWPTRRRRRAWRQPAPHDVVGVGHDLHPRPVRYACRLPAGGTPPGRAVGPPGSSASRRAPRGRRGSCRRAVGRCRLAA